MNIYNVAHMKFQFFNVAILSLYRPQNSFNANQAVNRQARRGTYLHNIGNTFIGSPQ